MRLRSTHRTYSPNTLRLLTCFFIFNPHETSMSSAVLPSSKPLPLPLRAAWQRLAAPFAIDLRSLALFLVGLGAMVAADALLRWRDLDAFHTDA